MDYDINCDKMGIEKIPHSDKLSGNSDGYPRGTGYHQSFTASCCLSCNR